MKLRIKGFAPLVAGLALIVSSPARADDEARLIDAQGTATRSAQLPPTEYVQPALSKMLEGYDDESSPWHPLLVATLTALEAQFGETHEVVGNPSTETQGPYEAVPDPSICSGCVQDWPGAEEDRHARK